MPFPLIIKPVDLTGGKGISVIQKEIDGYEAIEKAFGSVEANRRGSFLSASGSFLSCHAIHFS